MGISQIPTTTGTGKWVEIASSSPTSGTTVSFTSIAEYNDLAIFAYGINAGGSNTTLTVRLNNDSAGNYSRTAWYFNATNSRTDIQCQNGMSSFFGTRESGQGNGFQSIIEGANSPFKQITTRLFDLSGFESFNTWQSTDVINRIDVISSATYSSGTIKIFGRN